MRALRAGLPLYLVAWAASLALFLLAALVAVPAHRLEYVRLTHPRSTPLWVVVYFPSPPPPAPAPAAVICQPFTTPPEAARLLALELVRSGVVALAFDWRGRAPGENRQLMRTGARETLRADVAAAVDFLRGQPGVDRERIMLAGHSVGGTLALEVAVADPRIRAVAVIGMEADITPQAPANVLWAVGLYDEFRVLNRMLEVFQASAATAAPENTTVGDFARGTARRLGVSPTADHFTELLDRNIHREVRDWFRRAAGLPAVTDLPLLEARRLLLLLAWVAALLRALLALRRVAAARPLLLRGAAAAALVGVVLLSRLRGPGFLAAADATLFLLLFVLWGGFLATREAGSLARGGRLASRLGLAAWASLFLTLAVNNLANYAHQPRYVAALPEFALRHFLDLVYSYLFVYLRPFLFSAYSPEGVSPRAWVYVLMGAEVVVPGLLLGLMARSFRRPPSPARERKPMSARSVAALVVLLAALAGVAWVRWQQGFLTGESALAAARFLLRFTVLPLFLFTLLWRWLKPRTTPPLRGD